VELVQAMTRKEVFFLIWFAIVGTFSFLMVSFYRSNTRRNFRPPGDVPNPRGYFDPRRPGLPKDKSSERTPSGLPKNGSG
jgi:hypothetical protein